MGSSTDKHQFRSTAYTSVGFQTKKCKSIGIIYVRRTVQVPFFPQRAHPGLDSGAAPSMATLATSPTRYSLTISRVCHSSKYITRKHLEQVKLLSDKLK